MYRTTRFSIGSSKYHSELQQWWKVIISLKIGTKVKVGYISISINIIVKVKAFSMQNETFHNNVIIMSDASMSRCLMFNP